MNRSQALPLRLASLLLAFLVAATVATTLGACKKGDNGTGGTGAGGGTGGTSGAGGASLSSLVIQRLGSSGIDKIDLVLVVANTASMGDKQSVLSQAIGDLVNGLVNPPCLDDKTNQPIASGQPTDPAQACPAGSTREFQPVQDIHVGLLSSSLGTFGADGCPEQPPASCTSGASIPDDDHGHLVTRADPCGMATVPTYQGLGFLQWDPAQALNPPGIQSASALTTAVTSLVHGDGQLGCAFASQEEAWYRFLVDPTPYQSISLVNNQVQTQGIDNDLLSQRKAFLRPDSLLYVIEVSDRSDGSLKEYSAYPIFAAPELHLPHPSSACHFDPNDPSKATPSDPCCYSCGQSKPNGCTADPACTSSPNYTAADEDTALRAFGLTSHKGRYGIEFFYPPSRYVTALTSPLTTDASGKSVPNPIYSNLDPAIYKGSVRDPSRVFYAAVVGVPWQLIARQKNGVPDLIGGVSDLDPTQVGGFKTATELSLMDKTGAVYWDDIAGDPEHYVAPRSPFMVESTVPRSGTDPITGAQIAPITTPNGGGSMVGGGVLNDHERTIADPPDDIEYACIFDLPAPRDCTQPGVACDCPSTAGATTDNPLCLGTTQVKAKAYPGLRDLAIARGMGKQGAVASICPKQLTDPTAADYGYRPAVQAILRPLKAVFRAAGQCARQAPLVDASGQAECFFVEARTVNATCSCDPALARAPLSAAHQAAVSAIEHDPLYQTDRWNCFCEIAQLSGASLAACQANQSPAANGWCFVPGAASAADGCQGGEEALRFLGTSAPQSGASVFAFCLVP